MSRVVSWFSCGAASAVASWFQLQQDPERTVVAYCDLLGDEHPDNVRFLEECEAWFGVPILRLRSEKYSGVEDVFERRRYMSGVNGAICTVELKKKVREAFQLPDDVHVFGYTSEEGGRADKVRVNMPELVFSFPLIERGVTKQGCIDILLQAGIELPVMYRLGYQNNNCLGCVKGGSGYWNKIRRDFPEVFERRVVQSRRLGVKLVKATVDGVRRPVFLDELDPEAGHDVKSFDCGILCETVYN